jgi:hypothetical protein
LARDPADVESNFVIAPRPDILATADVFFHFPAPKRLGIANKFAIFGVMRVFLRNMFTNSMPCIGKK